MKKGIFIIFINQIYHIYLLIYSFSKLLRNNEVLKKQISNLNEKVFECKFLFIEIKLN